MREKIEKEFESLLNQFEGYFKHHSANAETLSTLMNSKTTPEDQERFKKAEFTAIEWEHLAKNNVLNQALSRTSAKLLALLSLNSSVGLELNENLVKRLYAIKGFPEAYESYSEAEVFFVNSEGNLQEKYAGGFDKFLEKTKEVTKNHYRDVRENIKKELEQFQ